MVVLQIVKDWPVIKGTLFVPGGISTGKGSSNTGNSFASGAAAGTIGAV